MLFGLWAWMGPRNHELHRGPDIPMGRSNFGGKGAHCKVCRLSAVELWKNGWTYRFAIWIVDSVGPKEAQVQSCSPGSANVPDDTLPWAVRKRLNWSICRLGCAWLGWTEESTSSIVFARWRQWALMGGTLAPPDECDWTVRLRRRCGLMSNYFDHLL